jgi:hypothetical protein
LPDNWAVRGRAVLVMTILLVSAVTACTSGATSVQPSKPATAVRSTIPRYSQFGGPGCRPPSPVTLFRSFLPQVEGTGQGATLWGLLMLTHALPARVGDQGKIVWRMTGTGFLTLEAIDPEGTHHRPVWGPDAHLSSDWNKPGDEWGAGYLFTAPGCWDLRATRGRATADVWLTVGSR